jgi:iron complex outermembrane receptor protein
MKNLNIKCKLLFTIPIITMSSFSLALAQDINSTTNSNGNVLEEIRILAHPLAKEGLAQDVTVLMGEELEKNLQNSLGETLKKQAGIQSATYAGSVGRPIIRGLNGPRVKTTMDQIDSLDASVMSGDHAVSIDPYTANSITVLKGPSTLLYGSSAIGGVVDVETGRIPTNRIQETTGRAQLSASDNANARNGQIRIDAPLGQNFMVHMDAFVSDADDYDMPGSAESAAQHAKEEAEEGHEEHEEEAVATGKLVGSRNERAGGAVGLSYIGDRGFLGFSVSSFQSEYGLFGHEHHEEEEEEGHEEEGHEEEGHEEGGHEEGGQGLIDLSQTRYDIHGNLENPLPGFESLDFRLGVNDYEHKELEGNGEVGTTFSNEAWEGRLQLAHMELNGFTGVFGLQANSREFSAIGEEAFVEPVKTKSVGVFWVGERSFNAFDLETGLRFEDLDHEPTKIGSKNINFNTHSGSIGLIRSINENLNVSLLFDVSSRAPAIEELYSNGPHLATSSFEIGNQNFVEEKAKALTLNAAYQNEFLEFDFSAYYMDFDNFIYQKSMGTEEDHLAVFNYQQDAADFYGFDMQGLFHLGVFATGDLDLTFLYDTVRGQLSSDVRGVNNNLPRVPASRVGVGFSWVSSSWSIDLDWLHVDGQKRTSFDELPTESYNDLSLYVARPIDFGKNQLTIFLRGRNLTDEEQRYHGSIVKDIAPAAGRTIQIGARMNF